MAVKPTTSRLVELLEEWFVNDESLPKRKREQAKIIVEELKGIPNEDTRRSS